MEQLYVSLVVPTLSMFPSRATHKSFLVRPATSTHTKYLSE